MALNSMLLNAAAVIGMANSFENCAVATLK
jgi:hypothetical protein